MAKRLYSPSILVNAVEYKCRARSVSLEPTGVDLNFCEEEYAFMAEIELGYGTAESWNVLNALSDTIVPVVLKPEDAVVSDTNPSATFSIRMPSIPFMPSTARGDRMVITIEAMTEAEPVTTITP